ncbi:MAG: acyl-CoA dehydrogenase [Deltaproteobacteria bacterium HGW-Deltaproteobacteria-19]|jgi:isovaleryl-CoA dehydrogenase|nr:MAG: acyl-CoA dehydrogenase [Deltaproteobacteria bacterium HGW-Deltaproteobacteria-19]
MALDFTFTEEQRMLEDQVYRWATTWLEPQMEHMYEVDEMPPTIFKELGNLGVNGIVFDEKYGGAALGYVETLLVYETIARVSNALSMTVGASQTLCFDNFRRNASEEQRAYVLPKACTGEWIGCLGITEPNAGSDAMSMATKAEKKGDKYIINGSKIFITNGPVAQFMTFYAKTDPAAGPKGISAFCFEFDKVKGCKREKIKKWGMRTSPTALITFEDMELPESALIGGLNKGVAILTSGLCTERITLSGCTLGGQRTCLELSLKYAKERVQFGKPIASFQTIQEKLANMYCGYKAGKWLAYSAAAYTDTLTNKSGGKGTDLDRMAAAALLYTGEMGTKIGLDAIQIHGGYGYCTEYAISRHFLDQKLWEIGAGTSEIRRMIIARELMRDDFKSGL